MQLRNIRKVYYINKEVELLEESLQKAYQEREQLEKLVEKIQDPEIRVIVRLRCINNVGWQEIGEEIGMDRRTASRKYYDFFGKQE
ncbi:MAG: hypothetical protein FWE25_11110 [Lachnospiraceae bacterium]|nr:hypothetical protein [Lachnospiraceae bacterium]